MCWNERFEVHEDESGSWWHPRFVVYDNHTGDEVKGFDNEEEAINAAGELNLKEEKIS